MPSPSSNSPTSALQQPPSAVRGVAPSVNGWNAEYLQAQYAQYQADPASVPADMQSFYAGFDLALSSGSGGASAPTGDISQALRIHAGTRSLIHAYRSYGHFAASIDPFGRTRDPHPQTSLAAHGLNPADLNTQVDPGDLVLARPCTLKNVIDHLQAVYCGPIGVQFMHIADNAQRAWIAQRMETSGGRIPLTQKDKAGIFESLFRSEELEKFLQKRYPGDKRFSLEGGETLIPLTHRLIMAAVDKHAEEFMMGMPHRGRVNVLNTVLGKTYEQILTEFEDNWDPDFVDGGGDVKYHKGYSGSYTLPDGRQVHLAMASNPSHLESVAAVVMGRCRAKQRLRNDTERRRVVPIVMHGDAAVTGQGIVAELLNLGQIEGYTVGGTIHVVVNNLIGFTTGPQDSRSMPYCTDIALMTECPIFHVNAVDPEASVAVAQFAAEFRQEFRRDIFIDMVCWRKYGHNEQDDASVTQPILSELVKIQSKHSIPTRYAERLVAEGVLTSNQMAALQETIETALDRAQKQVKGGNPKGPGIDPGGRRWAGFGHDYTHTVADTKVSRELLTEVVRALGTAPDDFNVHPTSKKVMAARATLLETGALSHADAEVLAIGTLLLEGTAVRLSGQDSRRGTFAQRHAAIWDAVSGKPYIPLNNMRAIAPNPDDAGQKGPDGRPMQSRFCVYDSPLSEESVMGFDYGYSLADPNMLVMWEGQFGDFFNGAQVIVDQYMASAEIKWDRWSGLTLLLPHGYEGAGPEHSSARIERFLLLCANDNIQVCYPSTGAQHFHLLRRQVSRQRKFRKPLIVMTPKSYLRIPTSNINELMTGSFQEIIDDPIFDTANGQTKHERKNITRVLLCSGKFYHELSARRDELARFDTAIVRVEQFYPFNTDLAKQILSRYPGKAELFWCQEEPRNAGAFLFMDDTLRTHLGVKKLTYIGRDASATPATGSKHLHKDQQEAILTTAIGAAKKSDSGKHAVKH